MSPKRLEELRERIRALSEQAQVPSRDLENLAEAIGRRLRKGGKHPTYIMRGRPPLPISHHSAPIKRFTKNNILLVLEGDLDAYEEGLIDNEHNGNHSG
jgi:hypothetical protein